VAQEVESRVLIIGGYMTVQNDMPELLQSLLAQMQPAGKWAVLHTASDAHAWPMSNHEKGAFGLITNAPLETIQTRGDRKVLDDWRQGPLTAAMLEFQPVCLTKKPEDSEKNIEAAKAFATACKARGIPGYLLLLPGGLQATQQKGKPPKTMEAYQKDRAEQDAAYAPLLAAVPDLKVIPLHEVYWRLREELPELDIHSPRPGTDTHFSPREHYLAALTISAVLIGSRPETVPDPEATMEELKQDALASNAKWESRGQSEHGQPWIELDPKTAEVMWDLVWKTIEETK
jgi:hypothetical protein